MHIAFIYPTTTTNGNPDKYRKAYLPPLNLAILDRLTEFADPRHRVTIVNECVEEIDFGIDADLVCITALTSQAIRAYQIADAFRNKHTPVILGGVHPSLLPDEAAAHADAVVIGEVENIWADVLKDAQAGDLQPIYQDDQFPDLQRLVIPKWDHMNLSIYRRSFGRKMPRMPIYTTRGCVFNCAFCSVSKFFGRSYRCKPIANVLAELDATPAESFFFTDDNIICRKDYARELFGALADRKHPIRWFSQASTTLVNDPQLIRMAAKAGCTSMFFGVESISKDSLRASNKAFNKPETYVELAKTCLAEGIQPWYSIIFGHDGESVEAMHATAAFLKRHNIWNAVFWILTPLPGTDLWGTMRAQGRIADTNWEKYDLNHVVYNPDRYGRRELSRRFWRTFQAMYTAPSVFMRALYSQKTSRTGFVQSLLNQTYTVLQLRRQQHPYSMGIWKR